MHVYKAGFHTFFDEGTFTSPWNNDTIRYSKNWYRNTLKYKKYLLAFQIKLEKKSYGIKSENKTTLEKEDCWPKRLGQRNKIFEGMGRRDNVDTLSRFQIKCFFFFFLMHGNERKRVSFEYKAGIDVCLTTIII